MPRGSFLQSQYLCSPIEALSRAITTLDLPISGNAVAEPLEGVEANGYVLKGTRNSVSDPATHLTYLIKSDGKLALTWKVETNLRTLWLHSYVDAFQCDDIYGLVDWVWLPLTRSSKYPIPIIISCRNTNL
jgi:extracellular elastinolytic metalloproteinase